MPLSGMIACSVRAIEDKQEEQIIRSSCMSLLPHAAQQVGNNSSFTPRQHEAMTRFMKLILQPTFDGFAIIYHGSHHHT
jgi:hypothetical protein